MTIWGMAISWWIAKTTQKQTGRVILIVFPLQQWLYASASTLRLLLLLLLTVSEFIPGGSVLQCKTGQYNPVQFNTIQYNSTYHTE